MRSPYPINDFHVIDCVAIGFGMKSQLPRNWHCFSVAAQDGELKAIRAEERAKLQAEQGQLSLSTRNFARLGFTEASER